MTDVTLRDQLRQARSTARSALGEWGLEDQPLRVLRNLQNTTFKVGTGHVLRLSHPGYQSDAAIKSEAQFLDYLASAGLPVPRPVPTRSGELVMTVDGDRAVLFPFVSGRFASASFGPRKARIQGELVGRLHEATDKFNPPRAFHRLRFTPETLLAGKAGDDAGELSHEDIRKVVGNRKADVIERSAELVRETWSMLGSDRVIHTDITPWNTMWTKDGPFLIDFDDAAWGPLGYDLGVIRSEYDDLRNAETLWKHFVAGYEKVRDLPEGLPEALVGAKAGRLLLFVTWLILNLDDPQFAGSNQAREWMDDRIAALGAIVRARPRAAVKATSKVKATA